MTWPRKNWLEWSAFGTSLILVLTTVGYLAVSAGSDASLGPRIEARLGPAEPRRHTFAVPVTVANEGDRAAEQVEIRVELTTPGREAEHASLHLDYLPQHSTREGWVEFVHNPADGQMTARPLGYEIP